MGVLSVCAGVLLAVGGMALGWRHGKHLHASGIRVRGRLALRDVPLLACLILVFLSGNVFFVAATQSDIAPRCLPIVIAHYQAPVRMLANMFIMAFIFAVVAGAAYRDSKRLGAGILSLGTTIILVAHGYAARPEQPVQLGTPHLSPEGIVLQTNGASCAAAAGANVAQRFGIVTTEAAMARLMGTTDNGTTDDQIVYGLAELHLMAKRRHIADRDIRKVKAPAILLVDLVGGPNGHAVAFVGMQGEVAEIWDPAGGRSLHAVDQVRERWRGWAFEVFQAGR